MNLRFLAGREIGNTRERMRTYVLRLNYVLAPRTPERDLTWRSSFRANQVNVRSSGGNDDPMTTSVETDAEEKPHGDEGREQGITSASHGMPGMASRPAEAGGGGSRNRRSLLPAGGTQPANTLISHFQPLELRTAFCCLGRPVGGTLSRQL